MECGRGGGKGDIEMILHKNRYIIRSYLHHHI